MNLYIATIDSNHILLLTNKNMASRSRGRKENFSKTEKMILVQEVADRRDIIDGEVSLHLTAAMKEQAWDAVSEIVSKANGVVRTTEKVKREVQKTEVWAENKACKPEEGGGKNWWWTGTTTVGKDRRTAQHLFDRRGDLRYRQSGNVDVLFDLRVDDDGTGTTTVGKDRRTAQHLFDRRGDLRYRQSGNVDVLFDLRVDDDGIGTTTVGKARRTAQHLFDRRGDLRYRRSGNVDVLFDLRVDDDRTGTTTVGKDRRTAQHLFDRRGDLRYRRSGNVDVLFDLMSMTTGPAPPPLEKKEELLSTFLTEEAIYGIDGVETWTFSSTSE